MQVSDGFSLSLIRASDRGFAVACGILAGQEVGTSIWARPCVVSVSEGEANPDQLELFRRSD